MRKTFYIAADQVLVEKCLNGDQQAQYDLYQKYVQAMYNVAVRMVNHSEDAEDVIQEVFVKVFRNLHSSWKKTHNRLIISKISSILT